MVFSNDSLLGAGLGPLFYTPDVTNPVGNFITDTSKWILISGAYLASGGERFITIGNFFINDSTDTIHITGNGASYYYIDDVYVREMEQIPPMQAGSDTTICLGESATIGTTAQAGYVYNWSTYAGASVDSTAQLTVNPLQTTSYILYIEDTTAKPYSCRVDEWDVVTITVINCDTIDSIPPETENIVWLPNVFSPNGDGNNDVFRVRGSKINSIQFIIYDRWGEQVFESFNMSNGWDGTYKGEKLNPGVFVYYGRVVFEDGTERELKGNVTLVR